MCKSGGLIIAWHNEMCGEMIHHAVQALSPSSIRDEPLIFRNCEVDYTTPTPRLPWKDKSTLSLASQILDGTKTKKPEVIGGDCGNILLHNYLQNGTYDVVDV